MTKVRFPLRFLAVTFFIGTTTILFIRFTGNSSTKVYGDSIDRALQQIAICNGEDRPRQRALLLTLQFWSEFARQSNLRYWISFGTLVGFVKNDGLLPYSIDVSVNLMAEDMARLIELSRQNFSSNFQLKIQPDWFNVRYLDRQYYPQDGIRFIAPNAQLINRKDDVHLDIYPTYDYDPSISNSTNFTRTEFVSTNLTEYDADYNWISYPRSWTFPLKFCLFSLIKTLCPSKPMELVTMIYGSNALNSSETICQNGTWTEVDDN